MGIFKTRIYFKLKLSKKCSVWPPSALPPSAPIINLPFFKKMTENLKHLELQANIFRIFISLYYLPLVKISIKSIRWGWHGLDGLTWNYPIKHFFPLATVTMITGKMSFTHFHSSSCQGNIFVYQNHAVY